MGELQREVSGECGLCGEMGQTGSGYGMARLGLVLQVPKAGHYRLFGPDLLGNSILFPPESNPCGRGIGPSCPEAKPALIVSQVTSMA